MFSRHRRRQQPAARRPHKHMKRIRICQTLVLLLMWMACTVMAVDPFAISVQFVPSNANAVLSDDGRSWPDKGRQVVAVQVSIPAHHKLYADQFHVEIPSPFRLIPLRMSPPERQADPLSGEDKLVFTGALKALYAIENLNTNHLPVTVRWQGCNESVCFLPAAKTFMVSFDDPAGSSNAVVPLPEVNSAGAAVASRQTSDRTTADWRSFTNRFVIVGQRAGYISATDLLAFLNTAKGQGDGVAEAPLDRWSKRSLWLSILIILLGGLALNLTPCVLPMIPVNLAIIGAGTGTQSRKRGAGLGAVYGLGMTIAYGILGLMVVLAGAKFGAINASPWFNLSIAVLFAVLALAMFDVYAIDFSRFQGRFSAFGTRGGSGLGGAPAILALGALAAVLSGACVAPVVLSVLLLSAGLYAQGHGAALALPFILGLGMALPWPLAGAGLACLPKPGRWMERIKHGFGILILLASVYYAYTGLAIWRQPSQGQPLPSGAQDGWLNNLPEALALAEKEHKPVFIDFWASWCKNCHAMDATTFQNAKVSQELSAFVRLKLQSEHPNQSPDRDVLNTFDVMGLPSYVILKPKPVNP